MHSGLSLSFLFHWLGSNATCRTVYSSIDCVLHSAAPVALDNIKRHIKRHISLQVVPCYSCSFLFVVFCVFVFFFCSHWSLVDVPLIFFCPADHVPDWQPRVLLGMVEARSVNVKKTTTTSTCFCVRVCVCD